MPPTTPVGAKRQPGESIESCARLGRCLSVPTRPGAPSLYCCKQLSRLNYILLLITLGSCVTQPAASEHSSRSPDARQNCHLHTTDRPTAVFDNGAPTANRRVSSVFLNALQQLAWFQPTTDRLDTACPWFASHIWVKPASGTLGDLLYLCRVGRFSAHRPSSKNQKTSPAVASSASVHGHCVFIVYFILFYPRSLCGLYPSDSRSLQERITCTSASVSCRRGTSPAPDIHHSTLCTACASPVISAYPFRALQQAR